jgi:DNA-binding transcriptional MocR family regulator
MGTSMRTISTNLNISHDSVVADLKYAQSHGMIESLEQRVLSELVPLAIDTFKKKMLEDNDPFVAKTVLEQLARLSTRADRQKELTAAVDSLAEYRERRNRALPSVTITPANLPLLEGTISNAG